MTVGRVVLREGGIGASSDQAGAASGAPGSSRTTARIVSWLTPNSAARTRRLRVWARARIAASCSDDSLRLRGLVHEARAVRPATRRGGAWAMTNAKGDIM